MTRAESISLLADRRAPIAIIVALESIERDTNYGIAAMTFASPTRIEVDVGPVRSSRRRAELKSLGFWSIGGRMYRWSDVPWPKRIHSVSEAERIFGRGTPVTAAVARLFQGPADPTLNVHAVDVTIENGTAVMDAHCVRYPIVQISGTVEQIDEHGTRREIGRVT